ncbi:MAG TPA: MSHA biogenesis protein MshE, partial [Rhodocyclaceae bacterium]
DMGVPRYMVALSIQLVLAQRLLRVICPNCAVEVPPEPHEREWLRNELGDRVDNFKYKHGQGCAHCASTGYQGRQAVYEFIEMSNALVESVNHGDPNDFIRIGREQMGGNSLRRDAVRLVVNGRTTIEEAMRISTQLDE